MIHWPNMLLVAGTGRNVGKTTFVCNVINNVSKDQPIIAIKITPHLHELCRSCKIMFHSSDLIIAEETSLTSHKDSSKMLAAGAQIVYYIQGSDNQMEQVINLLTPLISNTTAIICESAALRNYLIPGQFVLINSSKGDKSNKNMDKLLIADKSIIDYNYKISDFNFKNGVWEK